MAWTTLHTEDFFAPERTDEAARRARKMENIYHAGQDKIWDGREVLQSLLEKHGGARMRLEDKKALARVFSSLMWGELAAWKVATQLATEIDDFEAKMAATSQAHDEARHFYVFHDYLAELGVEIPELDRATRFLLESVLNTDSLVEKLIGMQLFVETMAMTMFRMVRELNVDPVLSELLTYFERDEARHIGLGVQYSPDLTRNLSRLETAGLMAFQSRILIAALFSLKGMEPSLRRLDVDPRKLADAGRDMMVRIIDDVAESNHGVRVAALGAPAVTRSFDATREVMFPLEWGVRGRLKSVGRALLARPAA